MAFQRPFRESFISVPFRTGRSPAAAPSGGRHAVIKKSLPVLSPDRDFFIQVPSIDKGKHACQRVFPLLFALFALAGVSPPASQKPKITRKYIAGRCKTVLPEQKCVQTRKDPQGILAVLPRGLTQYGRISARQNRVCPCQSMVRNSIAHFPQNSTPVCAIVRFAARTFIYRV